jgi:DNA-directed RNA polymerase subunit M/transcription elongation factor TFIIS
MGRMFQAVCGKCSTRFAVRQGNGKKVHLLHCSRCGREKTVNTEDLAEFCRTSLNGFISCLAINPSERKSARKIPAAMTPIDDRKYTFILEHRAGICVCGAMFKVAGKVRCPKCRSSAFTRDPENPEITYF